jgi:pSer/pThr/pTyr-binding forkhead associated (FHA) protein
MPLTVIVRSAGGEDARLTFDGTQRVVIGRGQGSDVRLPDSSVSCRHATLRSQGADFLVVDEGSTNGTFVGSVRIARGTSRIVRSGDMVRVGRVWLELRIDQSPVTRDVAAATRDLAFALVSRAMAALGADRTTKVRIVEGRDQGKVLLLAEEGRAYVVGRSPHCDLPLADADASREHLRTVRQGGVVLVRDLTAKNGTWIGEVRAPDGVDVVWRSTQMIRIARTVLALDEPISDALARIERAPDEALTREEETAPAPPRAEGRHVSPHGLQGGTSIESQPAAATPLPGDPAGGGGDDLRKSYLGWSIVDMLVMAAAVGVLALSLAGLVWLLQR